MVHSLSGASLTLTSSQWRVFKSRYYVWCRVVPSAGLSLPSRPDSDKVYGTLTVHCADTRPLDAPLKGRDAAPTCARGDRSRVNPGHLSAQPCMFTSSGAETGNTYQHPGTRPGTPHTYESCMNHLSSMNHHTEADHTETPNDQTLRHTQVSAAHNR